MASVYEKGGRWYARWKDPSGKWRREVTACTRKRDAERIAEDLERKAERARHGLEPLPSTAPAMTFGELYTWWWDRYGSKRRSRSNAENDAFNRAHLAPLWSLALVEVTPEQVEDVLQSLTGDLAPKSINMLRGQLVTIFEKAPRSRWSGANPAKAVSRRKVLKRLPQVLRSEEVQVLLMHLDQKWRALFACAIWTGMRKGELLGLRKASIDLREDTITVERSYEAETTKGGHADMIPIAAELRPWLERAIIESPSALVFPRSDGSMQRDDLPLQDVLRRALGRAGIVDGYVNVCRRRKGRHQAASCDFEEETSEASRRPCPKCGFKLWPRAVPRPLRFHDLRHTAATLLLKAGVPAATVQRLLRHADIRTTIGTYGHLEISDLRTGVDSLSIPMARWLVPSVSQEGQPGKTKPPESLDFSKDSEGFHQSGRQDLNLRPLGPEPSALPG